MGSRLTQLRGHHGSRAPRNRWQEAREAYETSGAGNMQTAALPGGDGPGKRAQARLSDRAPGLGAFLLCPHPLCEGQPSSPFTLRSKFSSSRSLAWLSPPSDATGMDLREPCSHPFARPWCGCGRHSPIPLPQGRPQNLGYQSCKEMV